MKKTTIPESNTDQKERTVSGRLHKLVRRVFPIGMHFAIGYDKDYGMNKRSGWTVVIGHSIVYQFERSLIWALIKSIWRYQSWELESKLNA